MKKYIITSLLFFVPFVAMANDHCTNPNEYTIDRRCYVTDEQKTQKPYNSVAFVGNGCTGTIVKEKDGTPYLFTAKHCVPGRFKTTRPNLKLEMDVWDTVKIKLEHNNAEYEATKFVYGNYEDSPLTYDGDWAVYKLPESNKEDFLKIAVEKTKKKESMATLVGYGALKVMSDKEIHDFKQAYINQLESEGKEVDFTADDNKSIELAPKAFVQFSQKTGFVLIDAEPKLKVSFCKYNNENGGNGCQGWGANSGGPVFDKNGKIMAIVTGGENYIGGDRHAEIAKDAIEDNILLKNSIRINNINLQGKGSK